MSIIKHRYSMLTDFQKVHDFSTETYDKETLNRYLLPQYFECAQHLQWFDWLRAQRIGIWEDDSGIVGIACYEMQLGDIHLHTRKGYVTEAAAALINWVFEHEKTKCIVAIVKHDNEPSNKVIRKLGFKYEGEKNIDYDGDMTDFHYYRLEKASSLEAMNDFFAARVDGYDTHMLTNVEGCKEGYTKMGEIVAEHYSKVSKNGLPLLDLGCGTGLELDEIFKHLPNLSVMGVDLTKAMLDKLQEKFSDKKINLVCGSYFDVDFGKNTYSCAVSFQTMHHFTHEKKVALYKRIYDGLTTSGIYVECDYMVEHQADEDFYFAEYTRLRSAQKLSSDDFFHYDTPCTIENQIAMLKAAGFSTIEQVFRIENTTMLVARKEE